ncbi:site-2 protease family protein [Azospirillum picis]|uniref:Zn-dependent protease n=1 Tax=Azospirillum picis TaxID=488438 RepID=A0ABU0MTW0_9PROT|nr:site-2 protease family protein [Azospirillum picis]MBP2303178.1 Zn-dependent protease [Azospirillum picis]MDQ0536930.1 Zn-dependent protease [Azospirillum picis]
MEAWIFQVTAVALPAILAITLHEAAHGFVAWRLGDDTAYRMGRVTFNPIRHIDPVGTVLLPALMYFTTGFVFGWAKPVPVNFARLDHPRRDMVWVALAGPGTNFLLAVASALLWRLVNPDNSMVELWIRSAAEVSVLVNVILMVFNLIPLPPLDGGRVAVGILPDFLAVPLSRLERFGLLILLAAFFLLPALGRQIGVDLSVMHWVLGPPVDAVIDFIRALTGND